MGTGKFNARGNPVMDWHPIQEELEIPLSSFILQELETHAGLMNCLAGMQMLCYNYPMLGEQGWCSGEHSPPTNLARVQKVIHGLSLLFLPCTEGFFSGFSSFPPSTKTNSFKFKFDLETVDEDPLNVWQLLNPCLYRICYGKKKILYRERMLSLSLEHTPYLSFSNARCTTEFCNFTNWYSTT